MRGLYAPPLNIFEPFALVFKAIVCACSKLSTEHGPLITASSLPPILTPFMSITVSSFLNSRLTSLYGLEIGIISSTPGNVCTCLPFKSDSSPIAPITVLSTPSEIVSL